MKNFTMKDPFNDNLVEGVIYHSTEAYGDLLIQKVNGEPCQQYIHTTPKFYYPGKSTSPKRIGEIKDDWDEFIVYDKLDGTNICMFTYHDADSNIYTSFKTRLTPFLKENKFGNFLLMWKKLMEKYDLTPLMHDKSYNYGFEMYGSANQILIEYKKVLDLALLYRIDKNGSITPPPDVGLPIPERILNEKRGIHAGTVYRTLVGLHAHKFKENRSVEGSMWYVRYGDKWDVLKCKPVCVVEEQGSGTITIGVRDAYTTAKNALEQLDDLSDLYETTVLLLKETYEDELINIYDCNIRKAVDNVMNDVSFETDVINQYLALESSWSDGKGAVMKEIMQYYPKSISNKVFKVIMNYCEVNE